MTSRRDFLKQAAFLTAGGGLMGAIPASIQRAMAIEPAEGSTFLDAEHIVILMQENRSFDHSYGTLRGVRGYNDPRPFELPNGNPVFLQTNAAGETYAPFRLNIKETKATWIGSLPHGWRDQSLARHDGWYDHWLQYKRSGRRDVSGYPLTLGFYDRQDIPFYYALADAFTICDQNFCSSLTGTTPNRLHLWSGCIRERQSQDAKACVDNGDADYNTIVSWTTFPERLEDAGVSWAVYQNELTVDSGLSGEADSWLANYGDNPLEYFAQYGVFFSARHRERLAELAKTLPEAIAKLQAVPEPKPAAVAKELRSKTAQLERAKKGLAEWSAEAFARLPAKAQSIHRKAFVTNERSPDFRELETLTYEDGGEKREMRVPKGDVFHQFREDVNTGKLPTVSWLVAPEAFSDHPSAPWYGAWYVSEALDILTKNPEVWKKTIFILCYDENDGYYDHVPPFVPPVPGRPETGKVSAGIDTSVEHTTGEHGHRGPIGLGYRVPLVIASPWSRGGYVCSEVFDHTSIVRLLEEVLTHKTGRPIHEPNISKWRRTVCGDLTSVFRPYRGEKMELPKPVERVPFLESIHQARTKPNPSGFKKLSAEDIALARTQPAKCDWMPRQEPGTRPSCSLPYRLAAEGSLTPDRKAFQLSFSSGNVGAPFEAASYPADPARPIRSYAVAPGDTVVDSWPLAESADGGYRFRVRGPNGFFREFRGTASTEPKVTVEFSTTAEGDARVSFLNRESERDVTVQIADGYSKADSISITLPASPGNAAPTVHSFYLGGRKGWYDLRITIKGHDTYFRHYAGRVESGKESITDPAMA